MQKNLRALIMENLLWFMGSLIVAVFVWMFAVSQSDPIEQWRLGQRVPIRVVTDDGYIITEQSETTASIQLQAQRSVHEALEVDDVIVTADLHGLGPGTHIVPLTVTTTRQATILDRSPRQITVSLEIEESQLKPVQVVITAEPPLDYRYSSPEFSVLTVTVSGPLSQVQQVDAAQVSLDLTNQRTTYEDDARLTPVDVDGNPVTGVTVDPMVIGVRVPIDQRDDVKPMRVLANTVGDLPRGYLLTSFDYEPQSVYVSGPPDVLRGIGDTLFTAPVDFASHTEDFEVSVPVQLPDPSLILIPSRNVTVRVGIEAQTITRQLDRVPVEVIGAGGINSVQLSPDTVTVLITGPQPEIEALDESGVRVIVDASSIRPGESSAITPITTVRDGSIPDVNVQVIPAAIDVRLLPLPTPEQTAEATIEVTPEVTREADARAVP